MASMRIACVIVMLSLILTGTAAAAHGYGAFPDRVATTRHMDMPGCPGEHAKRSSLSCHYCCAANIAFLAGQVALPPVPPVGTPEVAVVFTLTGIGGEAAFKPPRRFL